jgi:hypothetical protein
MFRAVARYWLLCLKRAFSGKFWLAEKWTGGLSILLLLLQLFAPLPERFSEWLVVELPLYFMLLAFGGVVLAGFVVAPYEIHREELERRLALEQAAKPRLSAYLEGTGLLRSAGATTVETVSGRRTTAYNNVQSGMVAIYCRNVGGTATRECQAHIINGERLDGGIWRPLPIVEPIALSWQPTYPEASLSRRLLPNETARIWIAQVRPSGHVWLFRETHRLPAEYQQLLGPQGTYRLTIQITEGDAPALQVRVKIEAEPGTGDGTRPTHHGQGSVSIL